jgi:hypothetical protein
MFRPKRDDVAVAGEDSILESFICMLHQILLRVMRSRRMRWVVHVACMRTEKCIQSLY